ncbi:MAG: threonylcarbamoyl-AMP synthase [Gemmatimonadaceae bacterium]|nr:threonylcarbamoyl-AMP synthase [Gemmatimonadaceae bacterium]
MSCTVLPVDPVHPDPASIARAVEVLAAGELLAFPTETVYGLGASALDAEAVARIFAAKGRPAWNPVIAHVADVSGARALTSVWPKEAQRLADAFWPGPLTIILPRHARVPEIVTAGRDAVGVRVPAHPVALALLRAFNGPIAAPSANRFTRVSPTTAAHVADSLGDRVSCILDGGPCTVGIESTVVDLSGSTPTVLRPGMITRAQLAAVLERPVDVATVRVAADGASTDSQRSPGMSDRHYAPAADTWLFDPAQPAEIVAALASARDRVGVGRVVALLMQQPLRDALGLTPDDVVVPMPQDPEAYARALYSALHAADARGAVIVIIERPPETEAWSAIRDRLARATR